MKKQIYAIGLIALVGFISTNQAFSEHVNEDETIVCINGEVIEQKGYICGLFMADFDHPRTIQDIQQELYLNPNNDTFKMRLVD